MGQKCLFREELFLALILLWQKHLPLIYPALLLMEKAREYNLVRNKKKWVGLYSPQHWLLSITLEFLRAIESARKELDLRLL